MNTLLFVVFCALQAADAYTTWRVLGAGGSERNPLLARLMARFGVVRTLAAFKLALILLVGAVRMPHSLLLLLVALYVHVVAYNLMSMREQRAQG